MSKLLDRILGESNMIIALHQVKLKKGSGGVDGIEIEDIEEYIQNNWKRIKSQIKERKYKPQPVLRVEIPKSNGGTRNLGIPTVMDRIIQQAIAQVLTPICEQHFSEYSYGFRPNRSCETAVVKLLEYLNDGYDWIVDIDLEKFFDTVPQDKLMTLVNQIIHDGDTESLIRKYLQAGVMINGGKHKTLVGTPQGGNLSPLLSNIMLNQLDKELEKRGLHFVRYADDCIITVKSESAAKRVMYSVSRFIEKRLGLKVNMNKTKIVRPSKLTSRKWSISLVDRIIKLNQVIRGWINYFSLGFMKTAMTKVDEHLRTRIRVIIWKQWKKKSRRLWGLLKLGVPKWIADKVSGWGDHYQFIALKSVLKQAVSKPVLAGQGLVSCLDYYLEKHELKIGLNRRMPNGMYGGVRGARN